MSVLRPRVLAPIHGFNGPNGHGKSLALMEMAVRPALERGRTVYSNIPIHHELARTYADFRELLGVEHALIVCDDVQGVFPAREAAKTPPTLVRFLVSLRHSDLTFAWSSPSWSDAEKTIRKVTTRVTEARSYLPQVRYDVERFGDWPPRRLFRWRTWDASAYEEWTNGKRDRQKALSSRWYWRPWHDTHNLYDTLAPIPLSAHLDEYGICDGCGGTRPRHRCVCDSHSGRAGTATEEPSRPPAGLAAFETEPVVAVPPSDPTGAPVGSG